MFAVVKHAAGAVDLGKDIDLIGAAVAIRIDAAIDLAAISDSAKRAVFVASNIDVAVRRNAETRGITDLRRRGKDFCRKALGYFDLLEELLLAGTSFFFFLLLVFFLVVFFLDGQERFGWFRR